MDSGIYAVFLRGFQNLRGSRNLRRFFLHGFRNLGGIFGFSSLGLQNLREFFTRIPEFTRFFYADSGIYAVFFFARISVSLHLKCRINAGFFYADSGIYAVFLRGFRNLRSFFYAARIPRVKSDFSVFLALRGLNTSLKFKLY